MKLHKKLVLKVLAGVTLLLLAMFVTYIMKDVLSARQPLNALPTIQIEYNGGPLPAEHVTLASYSWRFFNTTKRDVFLTEDRLVELPPAPVMASASLDISFSFPCKEMKISRASGANSEFFDIAVNGAGGENTENPAPAGSVRLRTPANPGEYIYRVEATWGLRGSVQYYFKIVVPSYAD